ncbi:MAG TPA: RnfABCDGE type electron transport complex subunit B [Steroidobacteraceae bacterium]|nr:RnfABCDGE type electron transport complex subunit B [Steroidobacteraceae bacterium]
MSCGSADELAAAIDALLPQTQCTRCGYAGCAPYAAAIAAGAADIDRCPPGGAETIAALAGLLRRQTKPLNAACGAEGPPRVAFIDESRCVGCAKCLPPCPVDAIVGAARHLHTVIAARCTGCELCIAPCPVDCIEMRPAPPGLRNDPALNRARFTAHEARQRGREAQRAREIAAQKALVRRLPADAP